MPSFLLPQPPAAGRRHPLTQALCQGRSRESLFLKRAIALTLAFTCANIGWASAEPALAQVTDEPPTAPDASDDEAVRQVVNCMATATSDTVPWGHRYTYWLSGVAEFDETGAMRPISNDHAGDWILSITNSRFAPISTHTVLPYRGDRPLEFAFPAVSLQEWNTLGEATSGETAAVLSYPDANHGLYLAIRNTEGPGDPRQLFQVIHFLSDDTAMVSEVSACFIGPRPMVIGGLLGAR